MRIVFIVSFHQNCNCAAQNIPALLLHLKSACLTSESPGSKHKTIGAAGGSARRLNKKTVCTVRLLYIWGF